MTKSRVTSPTLSNDPHTNDNNPVRSKLLNRLNDKRRQIEQIEEQVEVVQRAVMANMAVFRNRKDAGTAYDMIGRQISYQNPGLEITDKIYLSTLRNANITQVIVDMARARTLSMEADIIPFQDAFYDLQTLRHSPESAFKILLTMDKKRIPLIPHQCDVILAAEHGLNSWALNHEIITLIENFLNPDATARADLMRGPFSSCWEYNDLVSPEFTKELRKKGHYMRLAHEYRDGDIDSTDQRGQNYKFLAELLRRGIIVNFMGTKTGLNFVEELQRDSEASDRIDLAAIATCQVNAKDPKTCLNSPILNSIIPLTLNHSSCQVLLDELKQHGYITNTTATDEKIAILMAEWPQIAEARVLNNNVWPMDYMNLSDNPSQQTKTDSSSNLEFLASVMLSLLILNYVICLVRQKITNNQRGKLFNPFTKDSVILRAIDPTRESKLHSIM